MNKNQINAVAYINTHNLIGIRAGQHRQTFLEIWMVVVDNRIFARSWGFAERSWYNTFLTEPIGAIQCGEDVFEINTIIPPDLSLLNERINEAYLEKYTGEHNQPYAIGITQPAHLEKTMEFVVVE